MVIWAYNILFVITSYSCSNFKKLYADIQCDFIILIFNIHHGKIRTRKDYEYIIDLRVKKITKRKIQKTN